MKNTELVWRELVDAAVTRGERLWDNLEDLAFRSGVAVSTAAYALRRPVEIGAVQRHHSGFTVVNPGKALTLLCAARSVAADALAVMTLGPTQIVNMRDSPMGRGLIEGGASAAVALLGGVNTVSDYSEHLIYLRTEDAVHEVREGLDGARPAHHDGVERDRVKVTFLRADKRAARVWRRHTSFAQTYADLFATPGWQASEFRLALDDKFLGKRDWDQG